MMRGPSVEVPAAARARLQELQLERDSAMDAHRSANLRLYALEPSADEHLRTRLSAERDRQAQRQNVLSRLLSHSNQFLMELKGVTLELAPAVKLELKNSETLDSALNTARAEVKSLHQKLQALRTAPLLLDDRKNLAMEYVATLIYQARPTVSFVRDQIRVAWRDDIITSKTDVLALLAWLAPEQILAALEREIEQQPTPGGALSANDRKQKIAELEAALDRFERAETAIVEKANGGGLSVLPRPDISPAAFLGVVIMKEVKSQAA
jgi:hypothetical protein